MRRTIALAVGTLALVILVAASTAAATTYWLHHQGSFYFADVPAGDPAGDHIGYAAEAGVTGGCASHRFCPDAYVTRRQMAVFLERQAVKEEINTWILIDYVYFDGQYFEYVPGGSDRFWWLQDRLLCLDDFDLLPYLVNP